MNYLGRKNFEENSYGLWRQYIREKEQGGFNSYCWGNKSLLKVSEKTKVLIDLEISFWLYVFF